MSRGAPGRGSLRTEVLTSIYQHRLLSTSQVRAMHLHDCSRRWNERVLAELTRRGLVAFVRPSRNRPRLYFLTLAGAQAVEVIPTRVETRRKLITPEQAAGPLWRHTFAVNDLGIAFMRTAREHHDDFGPFAWRHEIAHRAPKPGHARSELLISDALLTHLALGPSHELTFHYRLLELDRATVPQPARLPASSGATPTSTVTPPPIALNHPANPRGRRATRSSPTSSAYSRANPEPRSQGAHKPSSRSAAKTPDSKPRPRSGCRSPCSKTSKPRTVAAIWHQPNNPPKHSTGSGTHEAGNTPNEARKAVAEPIGHLTADDVMTGREVAALLHAPVSTIEDWARRNVLPSVKIGRRRLYIRQNIEATLIDGVDTPR